MWSRAWMCRRLPQHLSSAKTFQNGTAWANITPLSLVKLNMFKVFKICLWMFSLVFRKWPHCAIDYSRLWWEKNPLGFVIPRPHRSGSWLVKCFTVSTLWFGRLELRLGSPANCITLDATFRVFVCRFRYENEPEYGCCTKGCACNRKPVRPFTAFFFTSIVCLRYWWGCRSFETMHLRM